MRTTNRTLIIAKALGQQGGTVHDICKIIGVEVNDFLYSEMTPKGKQIDSDFIQGESLYSTCSPEHIKKTLSSGSCSLEIILGFIYEAQRHCGGGK
jgi:hypothetical protein